MATQNPPANGPAVAPNQAQGGQQQPSMNPGPFMLTPIIHHDKPKEGTKWVAIVDLCFGVLWLVVGAHFMALVVQVLLQVRKTARSRSAASADADASSGRVNPTETAFLAVFFLIATFLALFEAITAYALLKATRRGTAPKIAYQKAKFWRGWSAIFLIYCFNYGFLCISSGVYLESRSMIGIGIAYLVCFVIRSVFICIVNCYIWELEKGAFVIPASMMASKGIPKSILEQEQP